MSQSKTQLPLTPKSWEQLTPILKSLYDGVLAEPKNVVPKMAFADALMETAGDDFAGGQFRPFQEEWAEFIQKQIRGEDTAIQERLSWYIRGSIELTLGNYTSLYLQSGYTRVEKNETAGFWHFTNNLMGNVFCRYKNGFLSELMLPLIEIDKVTEFKKRVPINKIWLQTSHSPAATVAIETVGKDTGFVIEWESPLRGQMITITLNDILNDRSGEFSNYPRRTVPRIRRPKPEIIRFFVPFAKSGFAVGNEERFFYSSLSEFLGVDICLVP